MTREGSRVALVTGGAVRVGRGIALTLAEAGMDVAFTYHSSDEAAQRTAGEIEALGRRVLALQADLRDVQACQRAIQSVREGLGPLDVLVNSAASYVEEPLADVSEASFDAQIALNVRAPFFLAQAAADDLSRTGEGRVINISDLSANRPFPGRVVHSLSKAALLNLTYGLARELAPAVQVHAILPGPVDPPPEWDQETIDAEAQASPAKRWGTPRDVGEAVRFLATCSGFNTGMVLHVDGGLHLV